MADAGAMEWDNDLDDDIRPWLFAASRTGTAVGLATIIAADGGPRPVGAQMMVTADMRRGVLSGGCIDADVARHARDVLADGQSRRLVYGRGSPFLDLSLPCGRSLEVLVEQVAPDDPALRELGRLTDMRQPALWVSDGHARSCRPAIDGSPDVEPWEAWVLFQPYRRLVVVGSDAFGRAIAAQGLQIGWEVTLVGSLDPSVAPKGLRVLPSRTGSALATCELDAWTAVAVALHDTEAEVEALSTALRSNAFYVGAMGSRSRLAERCGRLRDAGLTPKAVARLHAPIGLPLGGHAPREVALSVMAEVVGAVRLPLLDRSRPEGLGPQALAALAVAPRPDLRRSL